MITWQDYEKAENKAKWIGEAIARYMRSDDYKNAVIEEDYEAGMDTTIRDNVRVIYELTGVAVPDFTSANNKISSNIYHRLNTQRAAYLCGNGITFASATEDVRDGKMVKVDATKDELGPDFDRAIYRAYYWALCNGVSYTFVHKGATKDKWEFDLFKKSEFLPLPDEETGLLRGGIRFWSLEWNKRPITAVLYTDGGIIKYRTKPGRYGLSALEKVEDLKPYRETVQESAADGLEVVDASNYSTLPIFPLSLNDRKLSTLVFLRPLIDATDMILSGLANDMQDCAQMYWTINNAMGMDDAALTQLRDRIKFLHMAAVDEQSGVSINPVTQEPPYQARQNGIAEINNKIYGEFGALDVHVIAAGSTNDHIEAAYKPMDEEADDAEYHLIKFIQNILDTMLGIDDTPVFKRSRISNEKELTEMIMLAADYLDDETVLNLLPFVSVDQVANILAKKDEENDARFKKVPPENEDETPDETDQDEVEE